MVREKTLGEGLSDLFFDLFVCLFVWGWGGGVRLQAASLNWYTSRQSSLFFLAGMTAGIACSRE